MLKLISDLIARNMPEGKPQIYVNARVKRSFKARAAIEGKSLMDYLDELEESTSGYTLKEIKEKIKQPDQDQPRK